MVWTSSEWALQFGAHGELILQRSLTSEMILRLDRLIQNTVGLIQNTVDPRKEG